MTSLNVVSSILEPGSLVRYLHGAYGWDASATAVLLRAGINHTYKISYQGKSFILRVYSLNWRTRSEIDAELELLCKLHAAGVPVANACSDNSGNYIQIIPAPEGDRFAVVFEFAPGAKMHQYPATLHYEAGKVMGQFHQAVANYSIARVNYDLPVLLETPFAQIARFLPEQTDEMQYLRGLAEDIATKLQLHQSHLRRGVVHFDIWFENFALTDSGSLILFDFDFCGNGRLGLDLAFYVMQVYNCERYDASAYEPKLAAFFDGYTSVLPLPDLEKDLLPQLGLSMFIFYVGVQCQRFENWSNTFLSEDYLKRFINGIIRRYDSLTRPVTAKRARTSGGGSCTRQPARARTPAIRSR